MKKTLLALGLAPVFLLALTFSFSVPGASACCIDHDQDGYGVAYLGDCPHPNELDCDDDTSGEPLLCETCTCGELDCIACARCINPGAVEGPYGDPTCSDGIDNDCDGLVDSLDEGCFECVLPEDCDDGNPCTDDSCVENACVYENNTDPCDDGDPCTMDDVCSEGSCLAGTPLDADEDGFVAEACGGDDCDDSDPEVYPGVYETPPDGPKCNDGIDNNCNGYIDENDAGCFPDPEWIPAEPADASEYGAPSQGKSRFSNLLFALLLPIGAVVLLRRVFRKR